MTPIIKWGAPLSGALCLMAAAYLIYRNSSKDMKQIYVMLKSYEKK